MFIMSLPILKIQKEIPRWSVNIPSLPSVNFRDNEHFAKFADGPGIRVFGWLF